MYSLAVWDMGRYIVSSDAFFFFPFFFCSVSLPQQKGTRLPKHTHDPGFLDDYPPLHHARRARAILEGGGGGP